MKTNIAACAVLTSLVVLLSCPYCLAVDTWPIDRVREKSVLSEEDFKIIEVFVQDATSELFDAQDFTQVARLRAVIVTRQSTQGQYAEQYSKFLRKYIAEAFAKTEDIEDAVRRHRVRVNLMILVAELENPRLIDIALGGVDDKDESVQYWAVRGLTRGRLIEKAEGAGGNSSATDKIASSFGEVVETASPEIVSVMADFCALANSEQSEALLLKISDWRIEKYAEWQATAGPIDVKVLKLLCDKLGAGASKADEFSTGRLAAGRRFGQLYSYALQKYVMALQQKDLLDAEQREQLASVLVEIEDKCVGKLTGLQQAVIKRAVELDDYNMLILERGRLLGDTGRRGEIPQKFGFDYGTADDGSRLTQPRDLPEPPRASG